MRAADNPYRVSRTDALEYRATGFCWSALLERLAASGGRGAIRGPHGSGKSTLLRGLAPRLREQGAAVHHLRPDPDDIERAERQLARLESTIAEGDAVLLDGADRLPARRWRRLQAAAAPAAWLVVTTHRRGRLPTLHRCRPTVELLAGLLTELDAEAAHDARGLFRRHGGDLRAALRECFDAAARSSAAR